MEEFKNYQEVEKRNSLKSLEAFPTLKISASELKAVEIKVEEKSFWGIAVKANKEEILIGYYQEKEYQLFETIDEIFLNESSSFIKNCIEELFSFGFFEVILSSKGFVCLDIPFVIYGKKRVYPFTSYSLLTHFKQDVLAEKYVISQEKEAKRIRKFYLNFCEDLLFFQDVGPYDQNKEIDRYKEVLEWAKKEVNFKTLQKLHKDFIFEPYFFESQDSHDTLGLGSKLWPVFKKTFINDLEGSKAFKKLDTLLSELSIEEASMIHTLALAHKSLITALYCLLQNKSASFFSTSLASLSRETISNFMKEVIEDIELNDPEGEDSNIESFVEERQIDAILLAKENFQAVQDFLTLFNQKENEFVKLAWEDEREGLEFKTSFQFCLNRNIHRPTIKHELIQAICAMNNRSHSRGGRVVVGIHKDLKQTGGDPVFHGIEIDGITTSRGLADTEKWSNDISRKLKEWTDTKITNFLDFQFTSYKNKTFAIIEVKPVSPIGLYPLQMKRDNETGKLVEGSTVDKNKQPIIWHRVQAKTEEASHKEISLLHAEREQINIET